MHQIPFALYLDLHWFQGDKLSDVEDRITSNERWMWRTTDRTTVFCCEGFQVRNFYFCGSILSRKEESLAESLVHKKSEVRWEQHKKVQFVTILIPILRTVITQEKAHLLDWCFGIKKLGCVLNVGMSAVYRGK